MLTPFHLAYNVKDLEAARTFYVDVLGCEAGRSAPTWIDVLFYGHQLSLHLGEPFETRATGKVDGVNVPMPHLGLVLNLERWQALADRLSARQVAFIIPPSVRYRGQVGQQWTMFFTDPSGNPIEIKGFSDLGTVFAS